MGDDLHIRYDPRVNKAFSEAMDRTWDKLDVENKQLIANQGLLFFLREIFMQGVRWEREREKN